MFKNMILVILFDMFLNPSFKMTIIVNIARATASTSKNLNYARKNLIYLKQVYTFQFDRIKFENPKSSLPLKRFIVPLLTILNPRKPNVRKKRICRILLILISTTTNLSHVYYVGPNLET